MSCPDISFLVPLAEILRISVTELLNGERCDNIGAEFAESALTESFTLFEAQKQRTRKKTHFYFLSCILILCLISAIILGKCIQDTRQATQRWNEITFGFELIESTISIDGLESLSENYDGTFTQDDYLALYGASMQLMERSTLLKDYAFFEESDSAQACRHELTENSYKLYYYLRDYCEITPSKITVHNQYREEVLLLMQNIINQYHNLEEIYLTEDASYRSSYVYSIRNIS